MMVFRGYLGRVVTPPRTTEPNVTIGRAKKKNHRFFFFVSEILFFFFLNSYNGEALDRPPEDK